MGQAVLSPTRTYFPVIKQILDEHQDNISGIIHNTGGGQTKCGNFSTGIHYIKDNLFELPPLFEHLSEVSDEEEIYQVFNCGSRLEIYTDQKTADNIISICKTYDLKAKVIGYTESYDAASAGSQGGKNMVTIKSKNNQFDYVR